MAIKMARESSLFFSVVDLMYCITVAKRSCYGLLKIKRSYHIVLYYVLIYFIHSGSQPTAMNAVLAHNGGAICPSYCVVSLDMPDRTWATSSEGVGQECFGLV
jgi:hypothetical protein